MDLSGKVALITGAARGQGRAFALRLSQAGAAVIGVDICAPVGAVDYAPATPADLAETVRLVQAGGGRMAARTVDVRDEAALSEAVRSGASELGGLHIVVAGAGVINWGRFWELSAEQYDAVIGVNVTGVWNTLRAAVPVMLEQGEGGSIIAISSVAGLKALPGAAHYSASKHAVVGLINAAAVELAPYSIRANTVHPWGVNTVLASGSATGDLIAANPSYAVSFGQLLPGSSEPADIAEAVAWLASDAARFVTGIQLPLDHGATAV
jgi:SDR family mycofactocin-dependent oxidoreductase